MVNGLPRRPMDIHVYAESRQQTCKLYSLSPVLGEHFPTVEHLYKLIVFKTKESRDFHQVNLRLIYTILNIFQRDGFFTLSDTFSNPNPGTDIHPKK